MRVIDRSLRRALLALGRRQSRKGMLERSARDATAAIKAAAAASPAYRQLLSEAGVDLARWLAAPEWSALPVLTKDNTFGRFALAELAGPSLATADLADVLTSSGRGGAVFGFRLSRRREFERAAFAIDLGLQDAFGVDQHSTLIVNCLPMGVVFGSRAATVANVSVREDMACAILRDVGPHFAQSLVCTDPLFMVRLLDHAEGIGLDWSRLSSSFILGEESLAEAQRDYFALRTGIDAGNSAGRLVASSMGVGELGLNLLFETRETIRIRRALREQPALRPLLGLGPDPQDLPSVFCFNPLRSHLEIAQPDAQGFGELIITLLGRPGVIALPRYATGDLGRLVSEVQHQELHRVVGASPWLPMILVHGRRSDRGVEGGPSVERVKEFLYADPAIARRISGAFRLTMPAPGRVVVTVQPAPALDASPQRVELLRLLGEAAAQPPPHGLPGAEFCLSAATQDSWGPALDYERKFRYTP